MKGITLIFILFHLSVLSQSIDVQNYTIDIIVSDENDKIEATNSILIKFDETCEFFTLDLISQGENGYGMLVTKVLLSAQDLRFEQINDSLLIYPDGISKGDIRTFDISYEGIPKDGLVIGKNKYGNRTIFGDNWPNRARNWFPCVDHPSDKATINYRITHPDHYTCVANGKLAAKESNTDKQTTTIYKSTIPLPTKVMVFGLAALYSDTITNENGPEHINWVYPEDSQKGFFDLKVAGKPLAFYSKNIGPYPYEKLYNVQSTTRFGGMENAGCIFYDENAFHGKGTMENLIAHEIAHQWFGNSATETDWQHLWLSEGFATYFTSLYLENEYGTTAMNKQLKKERERVIKFHHLVKLPVVDTITTDLMKLLNPNAYQKGAWILHMLRNKLGDTVFWNGIRNYYQNFEFKNAATNDFINTMEKTCGCELNDFMDPWLKETGHPMLKVETKTKARSTCLRIVQVQNNYIYNFPIEIELTYKDGSKELKIIDIGDKKTEIQTEKIIDSFVVDPNVKLLFEKVI